MGGGNPVLAEQRRSKTNKPQGRKASVGEAGSPHFGVAEVWVVHII